MCAPEILCETSTRSLRMASWRSSWPTKCPSSPRLPRPRPWLLRCHISLGGKLLCQALKTEIPDVKGLAEILKPKLKAEEKDGLDEVADPEATQAIVDKA